MVALYYDKTSLFRCRHCRFILCVLLLARQTPYADIIDNFFDLFDVVLQGIETLAQAVVLQIQQAEARVQVANEVGNVKRALVITHGHRVGGEPREF